MKNSVNKLGGTTLSLSFYDLSKLIRKIIKESKEARIIFVISAFAGVTRILDSIFIAMLQKNKDEIDSLFSIFKEIHLNRMRDLKIENSSFVDDILCQVDLFIHKDHISGNKTIDQAHLLSFGEILSSAIFFHFISKIKNKGVVLIDARSLFISKPYGSSYVEAQIELEATVQNINSLFIREKSKIFITQGFIATNEDSRDNTVLGYDGSDLSAAVITFSLISSYQYVNLTFWKDVLGVLKDLKYPSNIFPIMKIIEYIEYAELNSVPVRPDSIRLFFKINLEVLKKYLIINIRSSTEDCLGTILKP